VSFGSAPVLSDFFLTIHDHLVLFALAAAGVIPAVEMVVCLALRGWGAIYEEYCNQRRRCAKARERIS
jgi:hypothetical protein